LHPFRVRYAAPMLERCHAAWSWWSREMLAILPASARDAIARRRQKLFIEPEAAALRLGLGAADGMRELFSLPLDGAVDGDARIPRGVQQSILLMPAGKVLVRALTLPLAAEENLREVLGFEMDQHTPFTADQVYYDYIVRNRSLERREINVDLVYSPRREVDALLDAIGAHGIDVDVVTSRSRDGTNLRSVNLLPQEKRRSWRLFEHRLNIALAGVCAALLAVAIALPIAGKDRAIVEAEALVEAAAGEAREGNKIRRDLERLAAASRFLYEKKQGEIMAVEVLNEVSRILPDHTWLTRVDLAGDQLQLQGQSEASSSLIAIVEASPLFENAAFASPVVQVPGTESDRFLLSANIIRSRAE
jgi:general secretion pathway protein L